MSQSKNILIILTGSIACYKACSVISKLHQAGHKVKVVLSPSSLKFIGAATIEGLTGNSPITDMYSAGNVMDHIELVRWADLILVAPATANYINKIANGVGDDLLTTLFLAHDFSKPLLIAPAMNTKMYLHPVTQTSIQKLKSLQVEILETASGVLACGEIGSGRLLEPELILKEVERFLPARSSEKKTNSTAIKSIKVLITAGGTSEPLDDIRVITNKSTGKTSAVIADALIESGLEITYLHSKNSALPRNTCQSTSFESFKDLQDSLNTLLQQNQYDVVVHAAAVSDYSAVVHAGKIDSSQEEISLKLKKNPKLINTVKKLSPHTLLIGFKLTSTQDEDLIQTKVNSLFENAGCDFVVQNNWNSLQSAERQFRLYRAQSRNTYHSVQGLESLCAILFQIMTNNGENL